MSHHTLSRTAERVYWLGRYLERAECTARLVQVNSNLLIDLPKGLPLTWRTLVDIMGAQAHFSSLYDNADERNVVRYLTADTRNPGSLVSALAAARENARTIRELMPRVTFEYINEAHLAVKEALAGSLSRSRVTQTTDLAIRSVQHLHGFLSATMIHGSAWSFLRIGQFIERADMTTRIIDVRSVAPIGDAPDAVPAYASLEWRSVLRSLHSMEAYHMAVQQPVERALVLQFLFKQTDLPRSIVYALERMRGALRSLPRNDKPLAAANRVQRFLDQTDVGALDAPALHQFIDDLQRRLYEVDRTIDATYFHARLRVANQSQSQGQN